MEERREGKERTEIMSISKGEEMTVEGIVTKRKEVPVRSGQWSLRGGDVSTIMLECQGGDGSKVWLGGGNYSDVDGGLTYTRLDGFDAVQIGDKLFAKGNRVKTSSRSDAMNVTEFELIP